MGSFQVGSSQWRLLLPPIEPYTAMQDQAADSSTGAGERLRSPGTSSSSLKPQASRLTSPLWRTVVVGGGVILWVYAEAMLQLRCQVISDRWDESVAAMRNMNRRTSHGDWRWVPRPMNPKVEANKSDAQKLTKSKENT